MKRWIALFASIIMQSCLGMVYAWSAFVPALEREHQITAARSGLVFGVCIASFTVSMVFGGQLQKKYGPRIVGLIGGLIFFLGYLTGALSNGSYAMILGGFGLLAGMGIGFAYVCPLVTGVKWFPHHKGLITGLTVAGFGLGGVFFAKAAQHMLNNGMPILSIMGRVGDIVGLTVMLCSAFLFVPYKAGENSSAIIDNHNLREIFKERQFQFLFSEMFCGTFGGLLIIGNLKSLGISKGFVPEAATLAVMLFAAGNAAGRVTWGAVYDRIGKRIIVGCMLLLALGAVVMGFLTDKVSFYCATLIVAFAFGGYFVLYAARVADVFGVGRLSDVYPFVFLGYGIAGLAGPPVGGWLLHITESAFLPCIAVIIIAAVGSVISYMSVLIDNT